MKRVIAVIALLIAAAAVVVVVVNASATKPYEVRAIFDNAGFVIPGEDVKIAGVKVGKIDSLDVTRDFKAAVVLKITQSGYQDFRQDASCEIRPQSLIGERFVECSPTQPRQADAPLPPPLRKIASGPGKGQYLLPVQNTSKPVDLDLINDIMRDPERERLSLILNELGTGLAGRGADLNDVIRRADPALRETDRVLQILASQNRVLQELATNSDTVLAPLARERAHVAGAIRNSSAVAQATAERRGDLEADIARLPPFLAQLKPTMVRLGALSDEMTPVLSDLHAQAGKINTVIRQLGPFAAASTPAFRALGGTAKAGTPAMRHARPLIAQLRRATSALRPVGALGRAILESFQRTHGIERALDYVFYQVAAINGFDALGHYLRAGLIVNQCSNYAVNPVAGCSANFEGGSAASASASSSGAASASAGAAGSGDPVLERAARALDAALAGRKAEPARRRSAPVAANPAPAGAAPAASAPAARAPAAGAPRTGTGGAAPSPADALMNYLFGKDGG